MKIFVLILLNLSSIAAFSSDQTRREVAEQLFSVMNMDKQIDLMAENMRRMQIKQIRKLNLPSAAAPIADEYINKSTKLLFGTLKSKEVQSKYIDAYVETFTIEELKGILRFYKSNIGKQFIKKLPALTKNIMLVAQKQAEGILPQMNKLLIKLQSDLKRLEE